MTKEKIKDILTIGVSVFILVVVIGISYALFTYSGVGKKENKITTGAITMLYTESNNTISISNALPTTDNTGKKEKMQENTLILLLNHQLQVILILTMK